MTMMPGMAGLATSGMAMLGGINPFAGMVPGAAGAMPGAAGMGAMSNAIMVANLPSAILEEHVKELVSPFGEVNDSSPSAPLRFDSIRFVSFPVIYRNNKTLDPNTDNDYMTLVVVFSR